MSFFSTLHTSRLAVAALLSLAALASACTYSHGDPTIVVPCNDATADLARYSTVVSPIFDANCRRCHGTTYLADGGGYDFSTRQGIIAYGRPERMICCIEHTGCDDMPDNAAKLADCDIARIKAWILAGHPNN